MKMSFEQVQAIYVREQSKIGSKVYRADDLPVAFECITAEWLTDALCAKTPGAEVLDFLLAPAVEGTTNRRFISIRYNEAGREAGLPGRVFCKATHGLTNRYVLGLSGAARTEVDFYNRVRPLLADISAPVSAFAAFDPETFNSIVINRDLSQEVSEFCDQNTHVDRERAEDQVRLLARLHGQGYSNPKIVAELAHFVSWPEYFEKTLAFGMREGSEQGFELAVDLIPARLHRRAAEIWPATLEAIRLNEKLPPTLAHGDVHLKNWYITNQGAMSLGDWQCAARGHWGRDFGYCIGTALRIEDRRAWERDLMKLYLETLRAYGGPGLTFDEGWRHYRQQLISGLTWWTITYNPAPGMPDMQPMATSVEFVRRLATAMDDIDALDSLR